MTGTTLTDDRLFHALADATRRDIVRRTLVEELSVSNLAEGYPMSFAAVQKHVAVLERAGAVHKRRRGREQLVRGNVVALRDAARVLSDLEALWRGRIDRIADLLEPAPEPAPEPRISNPTGATMTVTDVTADHEALTLTLTSRFDAPVERVWQVWADPRQLERWWGPPTYPATVTEHDLTPGGRVVYLMTGPGGDQHGGWWRVHSVEAPHSLEFDDGFGDLEGEPAPGGPVTRTVVRLETDGDATVMRLITSFPSAEAMAQLEHMQMVEGITASLGQIPALVEQRAA